MFFLLTEPIATLPYPCLLEHVPKDAVPQNQGMSEIHTFWGRYQSNHRYLIFGGLLFEKKARSPILKGFGMYFSAVLRFTGQQ